MRVTWYLKSRDDLSVTITRNTLRNILMSLAGEEEMVQVNDPRFSNGTAILIRKEEIAGLECPSSELQRAMADE